MYVSLSLPYHRWNTVVHLVNFQGYHRVHTLAWNFLGFNCIERPSAGRDQLGERDEDEVRKARLNFLPYGHLSNTFSQEH